MDITSYLATHYVCAYMCNYVCMYVHTRRNSERKREGVCVCVFFGSLKVKLSLSRHKRHVNKLIRPNEEMEVVQVGYKRLG